MLTDDLENTGLLFLLSSSDRDDPSLRDLGSSYLGLPGVFNGISYVAQEKKAQFTRLALYTTSRQDFGENLSHTLSNLPKREKRQLSTAKIQHRLYELISKKTSPDFDGSPSKVLLTVGMQPGEGLSEKEFHAWYEEEHILLFRGIPGWRRSRRAELVDGDIETAPRFIAIHEWDSMEAFQTEEYKHATTTEWRERVVSMVDQSRRERILFDFEEVLSSTVV